MITVYSKPNCPHCVLAKKWLGENSLPFTEVDISLDSPAREFLRLEGHRTVPQLYVGKTLLVEGGNAGLRAVGIEMIRDRLGRLIKAI